MATKKKTEFEEHALYFVEWQDAHTVQDKWMDMDELKDQSQPFICRTVGWCTNITDKSVCFTQTCGACVNSEPQYSNTFVIPIGWITTVKKLS